MASLPRSITLPWAAVLAIASAALSGLGTAATLGRQLAVLDEIKPALERLASNRERIAVIEATCCSERTPRTSDVTPTGPLLWLASGATP